MLNKKIMILSLIFLSLLTISGVGASETYNDSPDLIGIANGDSMDEAGEILQGNPNGTFTDLANEISNASGELNLTRNYIYSDNDSNYKSGIYIDKSIIIDGNGFTIDGNYNARIFNVSSLNVVFRDIVFVNAGAAGDGGAIYGKGCSVVNCTFINNSASSRGGAIYGKGCSVVNCTFINNSASFDEGGAMYQGSAVNCTFIGNSAVKYGGGAISSGSAVNCTFIGNSARYGGAISNCPNAWNCTFINNSAWDFGGAMSGKGCRAEGCTFTGNSAGDYGGAMAYVSSAVNCTFIGNSAVKYGGGMYDGSAFNSTFINNFAIYYGGGAIFSGYAVNCIFINNDVSGVETENCTFIPVETVISAQNLTTAYGVSKKLIILLMDIEGNVLSGSQITVLLDGKSYSEFTDSNGEASIIIPDNLNPNTYTATISYAGDDICLPSSTTAEVIVNKAKTNISIEYNADELVVRLTNDESGLPIEGGDVKITIDDQIYAVETDANGRASISLADLDPKIYTVAVFYNGDDKYEPSNVTVKVIVGKSYANLSAVYNSITKELVVSLLNADTGSALKGANVIVNIAGVKYTVKINSKGEGKLSLANLDYGFYVTTLTYKGNANYYPSAVNVNIAVKEGVNLSANYLARSKELIVTLVDAVTGSALKGANVIVNVDGKDYSVRIASSGQARMPLDNLDYGTYNVSLSYKGNAKYAPVAVDIDVIVKEGVSLYAEYDCLTKELVVSLIDATVGSPLKGANVAVTIDGEKYTVKINSKGEGRLSLAGFDYGTYEVTLSYKGNAKYAPETVKMNVIVKDAVDISAVYDDNTEELTVTLVDAVTRAPLKGASVSVVIDNVKYSVKIKSTGQGKLLLDKLAEGSYIAIASYKGNAMYAPGQTSVTVVKK